MSDTIRFFTHTCTKETTKIANIFVLIKKVTHRTYFFMTDAIRFFIHTINNGDNANSGVFTFKYHIKPNINN